jgi:drug/metabolite transporter (DMT)-like permease
VPERLLPGAEPSHAARRAALRRPVTEHRPTRFADRLPQLALIAAAAVFGTTFLIVQEAERDAGVLPLIGARFTIAALALAPLALRRARRRPPDVGRLALDGGAAGLALAAGYVTQVQGLRTIDSSVSAFLTYLLVIFVPLIVAIRGRHAPGRPVVLGVVLAIGGMALLSGVGSGDGLGIGSGEAFTIGCAVAFSVHVLVLSAVSPRHDVVLLTFAQLAVVGITCGIGGFVTGGYGFDRASTWVAAAGLGLMASVVTFVLQTWAQGRLDAVRVSLLLTLEPIFAAVLGFVTGERIGWTGLAGAVLILGGILVVEVGSARSQVIPIELV